MESVFIAFWIIVLVTQVRKADSAIDDIMFEAEEESKKSMPTPLSLSSPSDDESVNEFSDDFYNYNVDGRQAKFAKYQYDILLQKEQYDNLMGKDLPLPPNRSRRNAIKEQDMLWTNGNIPYTIDESFNATVKLIIRNAIDMWSDWTCLNFYKDMNNKYNKLHFEHTTKGCGESMVGMQKGKQSIYLSHRCSTNVRVVAHEIGHAIGLVHEQMRQDRDEYVTVNRNNLMNTLTARENFEVMTKDQYQDFSKPYDYLSIMHYGKLFYSRNKTGNLVTITPKNESYLDIIGEVQTISYYDVKIICQLYNCSARCNSTCSGTGFMGAECQCMCRGISDDNPIKHCPIRESCSMPPVDYSKYVVLDKISFKTIPKDSGMFNNGTAFVIEWNDTDTCGEDSSTYTCHNGTWIGALPECHPGCVLKKNWKTQYTIFDDYITSTVSSGAENLDNSTLLDSYLHGDNITLNCKSNVTKMVTSQCNNGSWTTFILNCSEVKKPEVTVIIRKTSYITIAGQTIFLECDTDDVTGRVTLVWSRPRVGLPAGSIQDNGSLTIPNVQKSYAGNYMCTGIDIQTGRVGTDIALLNVEQIYDQPEVTVIIRKTSYITTAGDNVFFECYTDDVTGRITLVWSRPRVSLPTGSIQDNGSLTIPNVQKSYAGNYVCTGIDIQTGRVGTAIALLNVEQIFHGGWTDWEQWRECSQPCGIGLMKRYRQCSNPYPGPNGNPCFGDYTDIKQCVLRDCTRVHGGWADWAQWGECSQTCGTGLIKRSRQCSNPYPGPDGIPCFGDYTDTKLCLLEECTQIDPIVFFSMRETLPSMVDNVVVFQTKVETSPDDDYNTTTGKFTCRIPGLYHFFVTFTSHLKSPTVRNIFCTIRKNNVFKAYAVHSAFGKSGPSFNWRSASASVYLRLVIGDSVWVGNCRGYDYISTNISFHFVGALITAS